MSTLFEVKYSIHAVKPKLSELSYGTGVVWIEVEDEQSALDIAKRDIIERLSQELTITVTEISEGATLLEA